MLRLQHAGDDLRHQPMPHLDVLPADERDVKLVRTSPSANQLARAADARMPASEDEHAPPSHCQGARLSAVFAAWKPHMPCTPPEGGVDDEQM